MDPGAMTTRALLNCLIREVPEPERQVVGDGEYGWIRLPRSWRAPIAGVPLPADLRVRWARAVGYVQVRNPLGDW